MKKETRRKFLKLAGVSLAALGLGELVPPDSFAASGGGRKAAEPVLKRNPKALAAKRWGMIIDTRELDGEKVEAMKEACHKIHNVPAITDNKNHEIKWLWETEYKHAFPGREHEFVNERVHNLHFPVLCNHCKNPPCVRACPTKATFKRDDGIVLMDFHRCIGCRFCMAACPYGSRSFNFKNPRPYIHELNKKFPTRMKGVVEKCNFCAELLAVGKTPACAEASDGSLTFGDLDDPHSKVRELLKENYTIRRKASLGTEPSVYYIV